MRLLLCALLVLMNTCLEAGAHDVSKTAVTWNREISRIVYQRCASCHRDGGTAFSLMTYQEARPWALAIKDEVLSRRMPPWGAVKGFGEFRNDQGLTQEELQLITDWVDAGIRRGNNPNALPKVPKFNKVSTFQIPKDAIVVTGDFTLDRPLTLDGLVPTKAPSGATFQVVAMLPDGKVEPLVWLYEYKDSYQHPFLFRKPIALPRGTVIRGVPPSAGVAFLPAKRTKN